ncbi:heat shock protein beta-3-like [Empidonax traillii]|uniref:heat shock protein beta-3-like n=1 Tax=Empidonax traillii TaxID=164674 RepID=UPI000FFCEF9B|nr:heat shock protein beta-3-like [Empidonax traillii]
MVSELRYWVETPVCCQEQFAAQELEAHKLDHSLYALPNRPGLNETRVLLDVVQFHPEDIIQTFRGWLLIKAQHGPRMEKYCFISRNFTRQYKLPNGVENKNLSVLLCLDGILVVEIKNSVGKN